MAPPRNSVGSSTKLITRAVPPAEAERRLRPAIEVLYENNNPRQALRLLSQVENKKPGWASARALRAVALLRLGRKDEADKLAASVVDDIDKRLVPGDEDAAEKLHLFYRELPCRERLSANAYEVVAQANEDNFELSEASFAFQITARDIASAQKVATRLQRMSSKRKSPRSREQYALWVAVALYCGSFLREQDPKLLTLAAAMAERAVGTLPRLTAEHVRFVTRLLCDDKQFHTALALVDKRNFVMDEGERSRLRADVIYLSGDRDNTFEAYRSLILHENPDDWIYWLRMIDANENYDPVLALIDDICARSQADTHRPRACYLARLEIFHRRENFDDLVDGVADYLEMFGSKPVCAQDLQPYVLTLRRKFSHGSENDRWNAFASRNEGSVVEGGGQLDSAVSTSLNQQRINVCWTKLWLSCLSSSAEDLCKCYRALLVDDIKPSERQPGDDFLLLAAHKLLPVPEPGHSRYCCTDAIVEAIVMVEAGLSRSRFNYHFKLLLIRLNLILGSCESAFELWLSLDVKHIQIATLGHLILSPLFEFGLFEQLLDVAASFERLRSESDRDIPESISRSLSLGSLNAAIEFVEFRERLERSSVYYVVLYYEALCRIINSQSDSEAVERAWMVVGDGSRVSDEFLDGRCLLLKNEDEKSMLFWDTDSYDDHECRRNPMVQCQEKALPISSDSQKGILCDLLILRCILRLIRANGAQAKSADSNSFTSSVRDDDDLDLKRLDSAVANAQSPVSPRVRYLHELVTTISQLLSPLKSDSKRDRTAIAAVTARKANVQHLETAISDMSDKVCAQSSSKRHIAKSQSIKAIGRFSNDTLMLTSLALSSLNGYSMRCKQLKVDREESTCLSDLKQAAKRIVGEYTAAALSAAEQILCNVSPSPSDNSEWSGVCDAEQCNHSKSTSTGSPSAPIDIDYVDDQGQVRSSVELADELREKISVSHRSSLNSIVSCLQCIIQRLKFMSI